MACDSITHSRECVIGCGSSKTQLDQTKVVSLLQEKLLCYNLVLISILVRRYTC